MRFSWNPRTAALLTVLIGSLLLVATGSWLWFTPRFAGAAWGVSDMIHALTGWLAIGAIALYTAWHVPRSWRDRRTRVRLPGVALTVLVFATAATSVALVSTLLGSAAHLIALVHVLAATAAYAVGLWHAWPRGRARTKPRATDPALRPRRGRLDPRGWPAPLRSLLGLGCLVLLSGTGFVRLAHWMTIGAVTEVFPWVLWAEPYLQLAEFAWGRGRWATWVALVVVSAVWMRWLLFPRTPGTRSTAAILVGLTTSSLLIAALTWLIPLGAIAGVRVARAWPPRTDRILQENCGHCHSPFRPQHYIRSEEAWRRTVTRMRERNGAPVNDAAAEEVIAWLADYRGFSDAWLFRAKCLRCHGEHHLMQRPRTEEEWSWIVDRLGWLSPFAYRQNEKAAIKRHLAANLAAPPPPPGTAEHERWRVRVDLAEACNPCHSIGLILEDGALDDPVELVRRMRDKAPHLISDDAVDDLATALEQLPQEPAGWRREFPHDLLLESAR